MAGTAILLETITYIFQCTPPTCECDEPLSSTVSLLYLLLQDYILLISHDSDGNTVLSSADLGFGAPLHFVEEGTIDDIGTVVSVKVLDANVLQPTYPSKYSLNGKTYQTGIHHGTTM